MRALIDMNDAQVQSFDALAKALRQSRTAIDNYLDRHHSEQAVDGFGLWGQRKEDGLAYQQKVRGKW